MRHRGCDQGPCFVPTKMELLWGGHSSQGFAVALSAADPFFLSWLRGCSPSQMWGRGGGGCNVSPSLASANVCLGG